MISAIIATKAISNLFSYKNMRDETGGFLNVSVLKVGEEILYAVKGLCESIKESNAVSATIFSNSPHIWHLHPRNLGAFLSQTDKESIMQIGAIQALTLNGVPPLSLVASFHDKSVKDNEVFHSPSGLAVNRVEGEILEIKCYVVMPDPRCFNIEENGQRIENSFHPVDDKEGFISETSSGECFYGYKFIENLFAYCSKYTDSLLSMLRCLSGIYSPGIKPDPIDLMRALCFFNVLKRFGINKDKAILLKTGSGTKFVISLKEDVGFIIRELKTYIIEEELVKILQVVGD
ncbi:MAG: hypothetical protein ABIM44_08410 [candidate division WOR-3 bacterium]